MTTPISQDLIACLRCPENRQALALADASVVKALRDSTGDDSLEGALIREDGRRAYPIRDGFPILLIDEAIEIPQS